MGAVGGNVFTVDQSAANTREHTSNVIIGVRIWSCAINAVSVEKIAITRI